MAQRVNALVRRLDTHAVRQHWNRREEVSTRNKRLDARRKRVAVTLQLLVFKVQRLVTHRRSLPHVSGLLPAAAGMHRAIIERTLEREVFPFGARDRDIQLHLINGVRPKVFQTLLARFLRLHAINLQRGIVRTRRRRLIGPRPGGNTG